MRYNSSTPYLFVSPPWSIHPSFPCHWDYKSKNNIHTWLLYHYHHSLIFGILLIFHFSFHYVDEQWLFWWCGLKGWCYSERRCNGTSILSQYLIHETMNHLQYEIFTRYSLPLDVCLVYNVRIGLNNGNDLGEHRNPISTASNIWVVVACYVLIT